MAGQGWGRRGLCEPPPHESQTLDELCRARGSCGKGGGARAPKGTFGLVWGFGSFFIWLFFGRVTAELWPGGKEGQDRRGMRGRDDAGVDLDPAAAWISSGPSGFPGTDAAAPACRSRANSAIHRRAPCRLR